MRRPQTSVAQLGWTKGLVLASKRPGVDGLQGVCHPTRDGQPAIQRAIQRRALDYTAKSHSGWGGSGVGSAAAVGSVARRRVDSAGSGRGRSARRSTAGGAESSPAWKTPITRAIRYPCSSGLPLLRISVLRFTSFP